MTTWDLLELANFLRGIADGRGGPVSSAAARRARRWADQLEAEANERTPR